MTSKLVMLTYAEGAEKERSTVTLYKQCLFNARCGRMEDFYATIPLSRHKRIVFPKVAMLTCGQTAEPGKSSVWD
jgi:hypothetical protein